MIGFVECSTSVCRRWVVSHETMASLVGLAAVDDNAVRTSVTIQCLPEEAFRCRQIPVLAEPEFDRIADTIDSPVEKHPLSPNLDLGFIHVPFSRHVTLAQIVAFQQPRREMDHPAMDGGMIHDDAPLGHHLLQAQPISKVPAHDQSKWRPLKI
jgi:hypothetical protein